MTSEFWACTTRGRELPLTKVEETAGGENLGVSSGDQFLTFYISNAYFKSRVYSEDLGWVYML